MSSDSLRTNWLTEKHRFVLAATLLSRRTAHGAFAHRPSVSRGSFRWHLPYARRSTRTSCRRMKPRVFASCTPEEGKGIRWPARGGAACRDAVGVPGLAPHADPGRAHGGQPLRAVAGPELTAIGAQPPVPDGGHAGRDPPWPRQRCGRCAALTWASGRRVTAWRSAELGGAARGSTRWTPPATPLRRQPSATASRRTPRRQHESATSHYTMKRPWPGC